MQILPAHVHDASFDAQMYCVTVIRNFLGARQQLHASVLVCFAWVGWIWQRILSPGNAENLPDKITRYSYPVAHRFWSGTMAHLAGLGLSGIYEAQHRVCTDHTI